MDNSLLAGVGELEAHLQRPVDVEQAEQALALASGAVRAYCGWDLSYADTTLYADSDGGQVLGLPTLCLLDLKHVYIQEVKLTDDEYAQLRWSRKGQIYRAVPWPRHVTISADVIHGYNPVPDLIKLCTLDVAAKQMSNPMNLVSAVVGSVQRTWTTSGTSDPLLTALHQRLLDRYAI